MSDLINKEFIKYRRVIASLLRKIRPSASEQDIEDILQDTYVNTYQSSLKQKIQFPKAFMVKTAVRLANRHIMLAQRVDLREQVDDDFQQLSSAFGINLNETENDVIRREDFGFLCAAVERLPEQCRKVFVLKKIYGLSQREIAKKLNLSESTVEKHVAKGLLKTTDFYTTSVNSVPSGLAKKQTKAKRVVKHKRIN